jgi:hypothetical protein
MRKLTLAIFLIELIIIHQCFIVLATDDDSITCGSVLKLQNAADNIRLHSHEVKYGSWFWPAVSNRHGSK